MTSHYVYILAGKNYGPIYIEHVQDIVARIRDHKRGYLSQDDFRIDRLVFLEKHATKSAAMTRANALRKASREWVDALIERKNPNWLDIVAIKPATDKLAA